MLRWHLESAKLGKTAAIFLCLSEPSLFWLFCISQANFRFGDIDNRVSSCFIVLHVCQQISHLDLGFRWGRLMYILFLYQIRQNISNLINKKIQIPINLLKKRGHWKKNKKSCWEIFNLIINSWIRRFFKQAFCVYSKENKVPYLSKIDQGA